MTKRERSTPQLGSREFKPVWTRRALPTLLSVLLAAALITTFGGTHRSAAASTTYLCPCTVFSTQAVPNVTGSGDSAANELGVKFESSVSGSIEGIRFYKGKGNTGTHVGHLWTVNGTLLSSVTFTNESGSGWQQANFASPVPVSAGTVYVASYYAPNGHYADNVGYFSNSIVNGPLTALANGTSGSDGVYRWGSTGFPTSTYHSSNYWVDVVFNPRSTAPSTTSTTIAPTTTTSSTTSTTSTPSTTTSTTTTPPPAPSACSGVTIPSGASIQPAVDSSGGGTTFCIQGTHSLSSGIVPKAGDSFIGVPVSGYSGPAGALIDGQGTATYGIVGNNVGTVTVKNLAVEHFVGSNEVPVLGQNDEGPGWDIEDNYVAYNTYEGIFAGANSIVRGNHVEYNAQLGISGFQASGAQVSGNEVDHNGSSQYTTNEGGGIKVYKGSNVAISNNNVHDNTGTGIWLDTDVVNSSVSGNTVANNGDSNNSSYGIEIEITCSDTVSSNTVTGTSSESNSIMISSSHNISVTGNTTSGANAGVTLWEDTSRTTQAICGAPSVNNDTVNSNTETLGTGAQHSTGVFIYNGGTYTGVAPSGVSFTGNRYHATDCTTGAHWQWYASGNSNDGFSTWQNQIGQDTAGSCTT